MIIPGVQNPHWRPCFSQNACLERVEVVAVAQALDGGDARAVGLDGEHRAALDRPAVDVDRARAALARVAADVGAVRSRSSRSSSTRRRRGSTSTSLAAVDLERDMQLGHQGGPPSTDRRCAPFDRGLGWWCVARGHPPAPPARRPDGSWHAHASVRGVRMVRTCAARAQAGPPVATAGDFAPRGGVRRLATTRCGRAAQAATSWSAAARPSARVPISSSVMTNAGETWIATPRIERVEDAVPAGGGHDGLDRARVGGTDIGGQLDGPVSPTVRTSPTSGDVASAPSAARARARGPHPGDEVLALEDVEVRHRGGTRRGVAGVGVAVAEDRARDRVVPERGTDPGTRDHATQGHVPRGHALRERDEVGLDPVALAPHQAPVPAEPGDDLVGDEQDVELAAQLLEPREVAVSPAG